MSGSPGQVEEQGCTDEDGDQREDGVLETHLHQLWGAVSSGGMRSWVGERRVLVKVSRSESYPMYANPRTEMTAYT